MKLCALSYTLGQVGGLEPEAMVALTAECGLAGVEWVGLHGRSAEQLRALCDAAGLAAACYTFFAPGLPELDLRRDALDVCRRHLDEALVLGARTIMVPPTGDGGNRDRRRSRWIDGLRALAPLAAEAGLTLTIETFPGADSPAVTADDWEAFRAVPGLRLCFDTGNTATGEDPQVALARCIGDVAHVHLKDLAPVANPAPGAAPALDGRCYRACPMGAGVGGIAGVLQLLRRANYAGWASVEALDPVLSPADALRRDVAHLGEMDLR